MKKSSILSLLRKKSTIDYLKQHQISHIWLAGSFARNQHTDESDIDIVYEFDDAIDMKDRGIVSAKLYLEKKLGKTVDILDKECIHHLIKPYILSDMQEVW